MSNIKFVKLSTIEEDDLIQLMNNERVGRLLPLLTKEFTKEDCREFILEKKKMWDEFGYGPFAFVINGEFAGWGGLQPENGDADFALILHPRFWGWGKRIFTKVKDWAFEELDIDSITVLFPLTRKNSKVLLRFGFFEDGNLSINNYKFNRFRLLKN
mgnify:CR=1 FL=1